MRAGVDRAEQETRGGAAEAETRPGRGADSQRVADLGAAQETAGFRQRDVRPDRTAAEGQAEVSQPHRPVACYNYMLPLYRRTTALSKTSARLCS